MAWETRRGQRYYYRSRRIDGQPRKVYVGSGPEAEAAARNDATAREARQRNREQLQRLKKDEEPVRQLMAVMDEAVRLMIAGSLLTEGYHQHRGHWRKRRA